MDRVLKALLHNLKQHPFHHYPNYKVEEIDAKDIIRALEDIEQKELEEAKKPYDPSDNDGR